MPEAKPVIEIKDVLILSVGTLVLLLLQLRLA
jgi:hypothetical protein